jgi:choline-glycine betaine transporter
MQAAVSLFCSSQYLLLPLVIFFGRDNSDLRIIAVFLARIGILSLLHQVCVDNGIRAASRPMNTIVFLLVDEDE